MLSDAHGVEDGCRTVSGVNAGSLGYPLAGDTGDAFDSSQVKGLE